MKHSKKADEILGDDFWQKTYNLSNHRQASLRSLIDQLIENKEPDNLVKECSYELLVMELSINSSELIALKHKQVSEGIEWIGNQGNWVNLKQIAQHALKTAIKAAESDERGSLGSSVAKHYKMDLKFLNTGLSNYKKFIDEMKKMMMDEGVMHWLKAVQNKPESEHVASWKKSAKELIIDLLDMDDKVDLYFDNSAGKLSIYKDRHQHPNFGTVNHWTIVYGDPAPEYSEGMYKSVGSEYFHMERKEQAVECLINRYLKEPTMIHIGSGSQSLEDIKATVG